LHAACGTTTLQGNKEPICGAAAIAGLAKPVLRAPRIRYGGISCPSFFIVAWTSISVSTPKPTLAQCLGDSLHRDIGGRRHQLAEHAVAHRNLL
jgi:hypothetical protein